MLSNITYLGKLCYNINIFLTDLKIKHVTGFFSPYRSKNNKCQMHLFLFVFVCLWGSYNLKITNTTFLVLTNLKMKYHVKCLFFICYLQDLNIKHDSL